MFEKNLDARSQLEARAVVQARRITLTPLPCAVFARMLLYNLTVIGYGTGWGLSEGIYLMTCQWHLLIKPKSHWGQK